MSSWQMTHNQILVAIVFGHEIHISIPTTLAVHSGFHCQSKYIQCVKSCQSDILAHDTSLNGASASSKTTPSDAFVAVSPTRPEHNCPSGLAAPCNCSQLEIKRENHQETKPNTTIHSASKASAIMPQRVNK